MTVSKVISIPFSISLFSRATATTPSAAARFPFLSAFPLKPLRSKNRHGSCYAVVETADSIQVQQREEEEQQQQPWTEWVNFVDRLKSKGYLIEKDNANVVTDADHDVNIYKDVNLLKEACLRFGRDRYDVFKLLSTGYIRTVVGAGCPNLNRKNVNSAKRLRAHLQMNEADVCTSCHLRSSCNRAFVLLKDDEVDASTADVVRVLLHHAIDPVAFSQEENLPDREPFQVAARKLLSELIEFSERTPAPPPPKPTTKVLSQKESDLNLCNDKRRKDVEMKRGNWMCPKCNFFNFSKNLRCLKCKEHSPKQVVSNNFDMKDGDWVCSKCEFMNFSRNVRCRKCRADGPKFINKPIEMKKGDWNCPSCGFMNFASNKSCLKCQEHRPKTQLTPGEWECPSCDFLNFSRNQVCLKCSCERPMEAVVDHDDDRIWRRPR